MEIHLNIFSSSKQLKTDQILILHSFEKISIFLQTFQIAQSLAPRSPADSETREPNFMQSEKFEQKPIFLKKLVRINI